MKEKKLDLRIQKTKKNLYESLLYLMEMNSFEKIKVSDICEKALVNRSTFYAHFEDKYMLLDSLITDLIENLKQELQKNKNISSSKEYYIEVMKLLFNHIEEKKEIYKLIMINNKNSIAMDMIYGALNDVIMQRVKEEKRQKEKVPIDFIAKFYLGAIFNVGMEWIKGYYKYSKEEIIEYVKDLLTISFYSKSN